MHLVIIRRNIKVSHQYLLKSFLRMLICTSIFNLIFHVASNAPRKALFEGPDGQILKIGTWCDRQRRRKSKYVTF